MSLSGLASSLLGTNLGVTPSGTNNLLGDLGANNMMGTFSGLFIGGLVAGLVIILALFVYLAFAHMKIAKRAGQSDGVAGTAWILGLGPVIIPYIISGMHWWPWLILTLGVFVVYIGAALTVMAAFQSMLLGGSLGSLIFGGLFMILGIIMLVIFSIFTIIWTWKMYKAVGRPGWWALLPVLLGILGYLLTFVGDFALLAALALVGSLLIVVAGILYLVFIGVAAWGSGGSERRK